MKNGIVINEVSYEAVEDTTEVSEDRTESGCKICKIQGVCGSLAFCPCVLFEHGFTTYHFELRNEKTI